MTVAAKLTLEAFLEMPETRPASEYEDGEVCQKPMPTVVHGVIQSLLAFVFILYARERGRGIAGSEIRCIFGPAGRERAYIPDVIFIADAPPGVGAANGPWQGAPDLAVEILSPDDRMTRIRRKVRFYLENGVRLVWLVDPEDRTVTVVTSLAGSTTLSEGEDLDGGDVLPGLRVRVREILPPVEAPSA